MLLRHLHLGSRLLQRPCGLSLLDPVPQTSTALARVEVVGHTEAVTSLHDRPRPMGFWKAFTYPFKGARFVFARHASLVRIWIWPIALIAAAHIGVVIAAGATHNDLLGLVWPDTATGFMWFLRWCVRLALLFTLVTVGLGIVYSTSSVVASPFNDALSERVERICLGLDPPPFALGKISRDVLASLYLTAIRLLAYGAVMALAFLASLVLPGVGQVVYSVFGWLFAMLYLTYDSTDWPLARRGLDFKARVGFIRRNLRPCLGMGAALWLVMSIPIVGLIFMPAAVTGGALLVLDLESAGSPLTPTAT